MSKYGGFETGTLDLTAVNDTIELDFTDWRTVQVDIVADTFSTAVVTLECSGNNGVSWFAVRDKTSTSITFNQSMLQPLPQEIGVTKCRVRVTVAAGSASTDAVVRLNLKR